MIINIINRGQSFESFLAMRRAAEDFVYTLSFSISTIESNFLASIAYFFNNKVPCFSWREANLNTFPESLFITKLTAPLHKLQTPSKRIILCVDCLFIPLKNSHYRVTMSILFIFNALRYFF